MAAVISLLAVLALSMLIIRIGTVALTMTGLSEEVASFQSLSAFSGAGFTTDESESVVLTRARRGVLRNLIRAGSVGIVTVIASAVLSFQGATEATDSRYIVLAIGLVGLIAIVRSPLFGRALTPMIRWALRNTSAIELRDYAALLHLGKGFTVAELTAAADGNLAGKRIDEIGLNDHGVTVLGVSRDATAEADAYVGAPAPDWELQPGDRLVLYGASEKLVTIATWAAGGADGDDAVVGEATQGQHELLAEELADDAAVPEDAQAEVEAARQDDSPTTDDTPQPPSQP